TGSVVTGAILQYSGGDTSGVVPKFITAFVSPVGSTFGLPIPPVVVLWVLLCGVVLTLERRTAVGRRIFALGANPTAARLALVSPMRTKIAVFSISAVCAAVAGILLGGFSGGASVTIG